MDTTPNLAMPYLMASQAQKHVTHNEALRALDAVVHLCVLDRNLTTPPIGPVDGDRYLVAAPATGVWAGRDGAVAAWQDNAWQYYEPQPGWVAWIDDEAVTLVFDGTAWIGFGSGGGGSTNPTPLVGVNATADTTNRLAIASPASLFNHEGAGHQQKINKAAAGDTASHLYQTGFSGRAEIGLTGDDDFHFKVSPDGAAWFEAIVIDKDTGDVSLPVAAAESGAGKLLKIGADGKISRTVTGMWYQPQVTIADNAVLVMQPAGSALFGAMIFFKTTSNGAPHGLFWARAASGPQTSAIHVVGGTAPGYYNTALTGTTGTDGRLNFGADAAGNVYIENRVGFAVAISAWVFI